MTEGRLSRRFYDRDVLQVAVDLLGAAVEHAGVVVRLTEVEAYAGVGDPGSHAFRGMTPRTQVLFAPPGSLYVYFTYGMHFCANLVTGPAGSGAAVLLRAGEVVHGAPIARARRERPGGPSIPVRDLARGPARLAVCLGLSGADNGLTTTQARCPVIVRAGPPVEPALVVRGPRVGVSGPGGDGSRYPWRLSLAGEPTVSSYRPAKPRARRRATDPTSATGPAGGDDAPARRYLVAGSDGGAAGLGGSRPTRSAPEGDTGP